MGEGGQDMTEIALRRAFMLKYRQENKQNRSMEVRDENKKKHEVNG